MTTVVIAKRRIESALAGQNSELEVYQECTEYCGKRTEPTGPKLVKGAFPRRQNTAK